MSEELELIDQDRIDEIIERNIGIKSVRVIADETGLKPEEVLRRKNELLENVDVLTIQQKRQQFMTRLLRIARTTEEDYANSPWETKAGLMNNALSAMKLMISEMNRAEKADTGRIEALNTLRKKEIVQLYVSVVDRGVKHISEKYDIPEDDLFEVFNQFMNEEASRLEV